LNRQEDTHREYFTDFDGRFKARLSAVIPTRGHEISEISGISARYDCRIKVEYQRDLMKLIEEGMLLAVKNFKSSAETDRYTLLEISRVHPEHFGLGGLSDRSYYPMQFEIIEQSVEDWGSDDKSTMMVQMSSIPLNYDMCIETGEEPRYLKGFSYPVVGERVHILNKDTINQIYNRKILEKMGRDWRKIEAESEARKSPRLGTVRMFEFEKEKIPVYIDLERLVRYHFGIFAFTGGGKSNLLSNVLRRIIYHMPQTKIIIFDISMEYPFLLQDVFADRSVGSMIVLDTKVENADQLYRCIVKPRDFEKDERPKKIFTSIIEQGKVSQYLRPRFTVPTYEEILSQISDQRKDSMERPHYIEAIDRIRHAVIDYVTTRKYELQKEIDEDFVAYLDRKATEAVVEFKVSEKSGLYSWATTRGTLHETLARAKDEKKKDGLTVERIQDLMENGTRLICLSIADPYTIKELAIDMSRRLLSQRKKEFKVEPYILFVFDEAQEFIPAADRARGIEKDCTSEIEVLLRQGRKYGLGACVATQRIAYLNTNALQQLHTYFIGTLPRPYDRTVVSSTFTIDQEILEKTLEFAPGDWLLSSYIATGIENVPIFIKADNAEDEIERRLKLQ
jgi:hypothetical protein